MLNRTVPHMIPPIAPGRELVPLVVTVAALDSKLRSPRPDTDTKEFNKKWLNSQK